MAQQKEVPAPWMEWKPRDKPGWFIPFLWIEWVCEWTAYKLGQWAFLDILNYLGRLTILLAVITWFVGFAERKEAQENQRKAKIFQAWQVINTAEGKPGSGGRVQALHDLRDEGAWLIGVDLQKAFLMGLKLPEADLRQANMEGAMLKFADLHGAILREANFKDTYLGEANLEDANLLKINLDGAYLRNANLRGIQKWREIGSLKYANLYGVINPPDGFVDWAIHEKGAVMIDSYSKWITLKENVHLYKEWKDEWEQEQNAKSKLGGTKPSNSLVQPTKRESNGVKSD